MSKKAIVVGLLIFSIAAVVTMIFAWTAKQFH